MGPPLSVDDVQLRLIEQARVLRTLLDPDLSDRVFKALADVWK
jgi:hypothetical protein